MYLYVPDAIVLWLHCDHAFLLGLYNMYPMIEKRVLVAEGTPQSYQGLRKDNNFGQVD